MGGWIALQLALDHPDKINRVVIYDAAGLEGGQTVHPDNIFAPADATQVQQLFNLMEPTGKPLPHNVAVDIQQAMAANQTVIGKQVSQMLTRREVLDGKLGGFQEPLLIVWGKTDELTPLAVGEHFHQLIPSSELDIVEGCGHLAPARCSQRVAAATADFLKANPVPVGQVRTLAEMGH